MCIRDRGYVTQLQRQSASQLSCATEQLRGQVAPVTIRNILFFLTTELLGSFLALNIPSCSDMKVHGLKVYTKHVIKSQDKIILNNNAKTS